MSQAGAGVPFLKRNPDDRLFRFHQGGRLRKLLAHAMANAGLSFPKRERGFHLFCHTYGTWLMRCGMDNYALARVTGRWKDPRSAEPYLHNLVSSEARRVAITGMTHTLTWKGSVVRSHYRPPAFAASRLRPASRLRRTLSAVALAKADYQIARVAIED
jgi:hypothetical protein